MKLVNTARCLSVKKKLRVAYFGGSITEGGGDNGWRGRTTRFLRDTWPEAEITEIMAAIGGTGSELGAYRCDRDVIAYRPDLTFIEYAVNDSSVNPGTVRRNIEAIVRKLMKSNPETEIMFVYTTTKTISDALAEGRPYTSREADEEVAFYYGWPSVDIGTPLASAVARADGDWLRYTGDTVHPNADGYAFCAEAAIGALKALLDTPLPDEPVLYPLPIPMTDGVPEDARLVGASDLCDSAAQPDTSAVHDWSRLYLTLANRWPDTVGSNKPGAALTIPFEGPAFGLYYMIASDSGILEYAIDGGEWKTLNTFDHYALSFCRAQFILLADDLDAGKHSIVLRVSQDKDERSVGRWIRIGALGLRG